MKLTKPNGKLKEAYRSLESGAEEVEVEQGRRPTRYSVTTMQLLYSSPLTRTHI